MSVLFLGLFTVFVASGCSCSCTSSMCSEDDEKNIQKQIEKQHIEEWRNSYTLAGNNIEHSAYTAYANSKIEELYLETDCGKSGQCSEQEIMSVKNSIKRANNNIWLNELESISEDRVNCKSSP